MADPHESARCGSAEGRAVFARLKDHMSPGAALSAKVLGGGAVELSAEGATVVLSDGRRLLDFGSYGVTLLGHRHPAVVASVAAAIERMASSTRVLANPETAAFAAELAGRCGEPLRRVWLGSNGSDAVEAGLKLCRRSAGRLRVLVVEGAFHGKTLGALSLTRNSGFRHGQEPLLGSVTELRRDDRDAVRNEVDAGDVAALVFEPIQGEGGVRALDIDVLRRWTSDARAAGAYVISDEVQVGLGRSGPFSPSLDAGLEPDAVLFGKALGGGVMPLSALVATDDLAAPLVEDPTWHSATFGGHPLSCAAGRAALVALESASPQGKRASVLLEHGLRELSSTHPDVLVEVRGAGLIWGIEVRTPGAAGALLIELAQRGLIVSPCLSAQTTIRLLPPMVTSPSQVDEALEILSAALPAAAAYG